ncbi:MAG: deaminase [bacterium]
MAINRNNEELDFLKKELDVHKKNLARLNLQKAKFGTLNVPLHILNQIDDEENEIKRLEQEIKKEKISKYNGLDTQDTQNTKDRIILEEEKFMQLAIEEAKKSISEKGKTPLYVGAVVVKDGEVLGKAHRGELSEGEHAEYTLLERKLLKVDLSGTTLYTTLEPCTTRNHPKIPCARRIVQRRIGKVVIGILDPNPDIRGEGVWILTDNKVKVEHFPDGLQEEIRQLNQEFIKEQRDRGDEEQTKEEKAKMEKPRKEQNIQNITVTGGTGAIISQASRDIIINSSLPTPEKKPVTELLKELGKDYEKRLKEGL